VSTIGAPAVGIHASVVRGDDSVPVAPALWSDNDVTLFAGDEISLTARYRAALSDERPRVLIDGFNLAAPVRA
jgi:exo-1,4-beta-D-glucosaminidase